MRLFSLRALGMAGAAILLLETVPSDARKLLASKDGSQSANSSPAHGNDETERKYVKILQNAKALADLEEKKSELERLQELQKACAGKISEVLAQHETIMAEMDAVIEANKRSGTVDIDNVAELVRKQADAMSRRQVLERELDEIAGRMHELRFEVQKKKFV